MPPLTGPKVNAATARRRSAGAAAKVPIIPVDADGEPIHCTNEGDFSWSGETLRLLFGIAMMAFFGPYVVVQISCCTLWEWLDKRTINLVGASTRFAEWVSPVTNHFVRNPNDGFVVLMLILQGVLLPAYFFYELNYAATHGVSWARIFVYNLVRIGPMYMNFMYNYVLCHKEAHNGGVMFSNPYNPVLRWVFNRWVGLFHGSLPGTFSISHTLNHHKYDNGDKDVVCTLYRPRDRFTTLLRFLPTWFAYACNLTTIQALWGEGRKNLTLMAAGGTVYWLAFVALCAWVEPTFTFWTLIYAFVESNILLAVVQIGWHALVDEDDPTNDYINSTTIVNGLNFTLSEEYHVVHHQYPGVHWSKNTNLFESHEKDYLACVPAAFCDKNLFEVYGMMAAGDYHGLADIFYQPFNPGLSRDELALIIKRRLRSSGKALAARVTRTTRGDFYR